MMSLMLKYDFFLKIWFKAQRISGIDHISILPNKEQHRFVIEINRKFQCE